jgi:predicted RecB family nuclease
MTTRRRMPLETVPVTRIKPASEESIADRLTRRAEALAAKIEKHRTELLTLERDARAVGLRVPLTAPTMAALAGATRQLKDALNGYRTQLPLELDASA